MRDVNDPESRTLVSFVGFAGSMFYFYCPLPVQVHTSTQKYGETAVQTVRTGIVSHGVAMEPQACPVYSSGGESKPPVFKKFAIEKVTARQEKALRQPLCPCGPCLSAGFQHACPYTVPVPSRYGKSGLEPIELHFVIIKTYH